MIYIDNNATTKIDEEVLEAMTPYLREEYGNPGSKFYTLAENAKNAVEEAREKVAELVNAKPKEIIFTSSGSESNNFIIKGISDYLKNYEEKGNHLITSYFEHKSVFNSFRYLNGEIYMNKEKTKKMGQDSNKIDRGFNVDFLGGNAKGQINLNDLKEHIKDNTILGSFIWANNETGNLNLIEEIVKLFNEKDIFIHSDATQIVGKLGIDLEKTKLDAISFSSHKIYGPKGIGAAYLRSNKYTTKDITSLIHGGDDQEFGYRAGTPGVHNIVGFGKAAEIAKRDMQENIKHIKFLEKEFIKMLLSKFDNIKFLMDEDNKIPGIVSFVLPDINNQLYLKRLSKDVAFSSGSACTISTDTGMLDHLGLSEYKSNFFRVALGKNNTLEEIKELNNIFI